MAPPRMFEQSGSGFQQVTPAQAQEAFDAINAPLPLAFTQYELSDPLDALPNDLSRSRLLALRQHAADLRSTWLPISDAIREQRLEKQRADVRLKQLTLRRGEGGPELDDSDHQVVDVRKKIKRCDDEIARLSGLEATRGPAMHGAALLLRACEDWLRRGKPGGTTLIEAVIEITDVLKRGEKPVDAVERLRHRLRELDADAHRIRSAAFPAAHCKQKLREQIDSLANSGVPDVSALIEHDANIDWPLTTQTFPLVAMVAKEGAAVTGRAQGETVDTLAMFVWLHRPQLLKAIDVQTDRCSCLF
jgi:hypothetical protein